MPLETGGVADRARETRIITFHTHTAFNGSTQALANVAWNLAFEKKNVLVVDLNLWAARMDCRVRRYLEPFSPFPLDGIAGITDMIQQVCQTVKERQGIGIKDICRDHADVSKKFTYVLPSPKLPNALQGRIDYLGPGTKLFPKHGGYLEAFGQQDAAEHFIGEFRTSLRSQGYDYVLVDTAAGETPPLIRSSMVLLPDVIAWSLPFDRGEHLSEAIKAYGDLRTQMGDTNRHPVIPFVGKAFGSEQARRDAYGRIREEFELPRLNGAEVLVQIPQVERYVDRYTIAHFAEEPTTATPCLEQYEKLTAILTNGEVGRVGALPSTTRITIGNLMRGARAVNGGRVTLLSTCADRPWADWIAVQLRRAGLRVERADLSSADRVRAEAEQAEGTVLLVVSKHLRGSRSLRTAVGIATRLAQGRQEGLELVPVHVDHTDTPADLGDPGHGGFGVSRQIHLAYSPEQEAREALLGHFELRSPGDASADGPRFPGHTMPRIGEVPESNPHFVGRERRLDEMRRHLGYGSRTAAPIVLTGGTGVGKASIAAEYVHRFATDYDVIHWIQADHPDGITQAHASLLEQIRQRTKQGEGPLSDLREAVSRPPEDDGAPRHRWLLVYVNAGAPGDILERIPDRSLHHTIITSSDQSWTAVRGVTVVPVTAFDPGESRALFRRRKVRLSEEEVDHVAERVGHDPRTLNRIVETVHTYREQGLTRELDDYLATVTKDKSLVTVLDQLERFHPASLRLLRICAHLHPHGIPMEALQTESATRAYGEADAMFGEKYHFGSVLYQATLNSLLEKGSRELLRVSPRVQSTVLDHAGEENGARARELVHRILSEYAPSDAEMDDRRHNARYTWLGRQVEASGAVESDVAGVRRWLVNQVRFHYRNSEHPRAVEIGERLRPRWQKLFGEVDDLLLRLNTQLANSYRALGRYEEASRLTEATLDHQQRLYDTPHPFTLSTLRSHAADLRLQGRYVEAGKKDNAAVDGYQELGGTNELDVSISRHNLSLSLAGAGKYEDALQESIAAYEIQSRESVLGPRDPWTLVTETTMGSHYRYLGHHKRAEGIVTRGHQLLTAIMGEHDSDALNAHKELVTVWRLQRNQDMVSRLPSLIEEIRRAHADGYGDDHERTLSMEVELAACLAVSGDARGAHEQSLANLASYQKRFGEGHLFTAVVESNLSAHAWLDGDEGAALEHAKNACEHLSENEGVNEEHPLLIGAKLNLANVHSLGGDESLNLAGSLEADALLKLPKDLAKHPLAEIAQQNQRATMDRKQAPENTAVSTPRNYVDATIPEI